VIALAEADVRFFLVAQHGGNPAIGHGHRSALSFNARLGQQGVDPLLELVVFLVQLLARVLQLADARLQLLPGLADLLGQILFHRA
jgi:hypothetical protein